MTAARSSKKKKKGMKSHGEGELFLFWCTKISYSCDNWVRSHGLQNTASASVTLWERCECTLANLLNREHISNETTGRSRCRRELRMWASLKGWSKIPSHQQNWPNKASRVVQILFLRPLVTKGHLSLETVLVDVLCQTHLSSVSVQPVTRWPQALQTSGISTCFHANTSYNYQ